VSAPVDPFESPDDFELPEWDGGESMTLADFTVNRGEILCGTCHLVHRADRECDG